MNKIRQDAHDALEAELNPDMVEYAARALWDTRDHTLLSHYGYSTNYASQPDAIRETLRKEAKAALTALSQCRYPGYTLVSTKTLEWLLGERGLFEPTPEQVDMHTKLVGKVSPYWWRTQLRQAMLK